MSQAESLFREIDLLELPPNGFSDAQHRRTPSVWGFDPEFPPEISIGLDPEDWGNSQQLVVARDLINDSFKGPAGEGDVRFYLNPEENPRHSLRRNPVMEINGYDGPRSYWIPRSQLYRFVCETFRKVPRGKENQIIRSRVEETLGLL